MKYIKIITLLTAIFSISGCNCCDENATPPKSEYDLAAYVWPAYQNDPRWKELGIFGDGVGEWQNVYEAKSKRKGHYQPFEPLWGYTMDDDPKSMEMQIDAATKAGLNVFIYDWYWYEGRPFLENALNNGFLKARNNKKMWFYLMWANHDVTYQWNNKVASKEKSKVIWSADVSFDEYKEKLVPRWIAYFKKSNYYKIENKPVFGIFEPRNLVRSMGSWAKVKEAFDYLESEAKKAGFAGVHFMINTSIYNETFGKMTDIPNKPKASTREVAEYLGFDSFSLYNWVGEIWQVMSVEKDYPYSKWVDKGIATYDYNKPLLPKSQLFPHVSLAWDTNPRYPMSDYQATVSDSTPEDFERGLRAAKNWIDKNVRTNYPKLITINAWNEWTEGCYIQPDKRHGYGFLNAIARVFGGEEQK